MPRFFIAGILLFLLLSAAGSSPSAQARTVPWDCADWQAFAHADRTTSILESLAENRGKTLYCGIDQSDTFAKAETWEAGRDHNERDDTVYQGERGRFRGFIAAQEGWLTDGESGITGQSIAVIFEFPKTGKTVRRTKRISVGSGSASDNPDNTCPDPSPNEAGDPQPGTLICGGWYASGGQYDWGNQHAAERVKASRDAIGIGRSNTWSHVKWDTNRVWSRLPNGEDNADLKAARITTEQWRAMAATAADSACRSRGARYVAGSADFGEGHSRDNGGSPTSASFMGNGLGFFSFQDPTPHGTLGTSVFRYQARQSRTWSATCVKKGPRR